MKLVLVVTNNMVLGFLIVEGRTLAHDCLHPHHLNSKGLFVSTH